MCFVRCMARNSHPALRRRWVDFDEVIFEPPHPIDLLFVSSHSFLFQFDSFVIDLFHEGNDWMFALPCHVLGNLDGGFCVRE